MNYKSSFVYGLFRGARYNFRSSENSVLPSFSGHEKSARLSCHNIHLYFLIKVKIMYFLSTMYCKVLLKNLYLQRERVAGLNPKHH